MAKVHDDCKPATPAGDAAPQGFRTAARWAWQDLKNNRASTWFAVGVFAVTCAAIILTPVVVLLHVMAAISASEKDQLALGFEAVAHLPSLGYSANPISLDGTYLHRTNVGASVFASQSLQSSHLRNGDWLILTLAGQLIFALVAGLPVIALTAFGLSPALSLTMWRYQHILGGTAGGQPPAATTPSVASSHVFPAPALAQPTDLRKMATIQGCIIGALGGIAGYLLAPLWCLAFGVVTGVVGPGMAIISLLTGVVWACLAPLAGAGAGRIAYFRHRRTVAKNLVQTPQQQPIQEQPILSSAENLLQQANPAQQTILTRQSKEKPVWLSFALAVGCWCGPVPALLLAVFYWPDDDNGWLALLGTSLVLGTVVAVFAGVVFCARGTIQLLSRWRGRSKLSGKRSIFTDSPGATSLVFIALVLCVSSSLWLGSVWADPDLPQGISPLIGVCVQSLWCVVGAWCTALWIATLPSPHVSFESTQPGPAQPGPAQADAIQAGQLQSGQLQSSQAHFELPQSRLLQLGLPPRVARRQAAKLATCAICAGTWWHPAFVYESRGEAVLWVLVIAWLIPLVGVPTLTAILAGKIATSVSHPAEVFCSTS